MNMMPNGNPFIGTSREKWPEEVKKLAKSLGNLSYQPKGNKDKEQLFLPKR